MSATVRPEPWRQALPWLLLALALHAGLLIVPLARQEAAAPGWTRIELRLAPPPARPPPATSPSAVPPAPPPTPERTSDAPVPTASAPPSFPPPASPVGERSRPVPLERQPWSLAPSPASPRALGAPPAGGRPEAWTRPLLPRESNLFDHAVVPREAEIVDRWQSSDGDHRVVVRSPDGNTYCGRANADNPLEPLVEPIMTWHACAGGGTRTRRGQALDFRATP